MTAANASCGGENSGPGVVVVKVGTTRLRVASVVTVAKAAPEPSALNETTSAAERAEEQRQADDPVARDHHGGEDRVSGQGLCFATAGDHQRDDERDLDDGDRDSEHERTERLANTVRDDFGVMHSGEHRRAEQ